MTASGSNPSMSAVAPRYGLWAGIAIACVAGGFLAAVTVMLALQQVGTATDTLFNSEDVAKLRAALVPGSETYDKDRDDLRKIDLEVRQRQSTRLALARRSGWMILGASVVLVGAAAFAASYRKRRPVKRPAPDIAAAQAAQATYLAGGSVAAVIVLLGAGGAALGLWAGGVPLDQTTAEVKPVAARTFPSPEEIAKQWPRFRGPGGSGVSAYANVPTTWDAATGQNILWKVEVPMPGLSSPVIWGDRIFLAGAVVEHQDPEETSSKVLSDKRAVFCFDAKTGKLLWQKPVETAVGKAAPPPKVDPACGYAPSTPVTDGQAVFAIFPNGDLAAFDFEGKQLWARSLGPISGPQANSYGYATSLEMYQNFVLVQLDQGLPGKTRSAVLALDASTGKTAWETRRNVSQSWATPILVHTDKGDQFVTASRPYVIAYDPATGTELWRAKVEEGEVAPSPVYANNVVYVANASANLSALRVDGSDDVTETGLLWKGEDGMPDISSPLTDGRRVWLLTTEGRMTCYDAKDGKKLYEKEFESSNKEVPASFRSSSGFAADHVYVTEESGITHVLAAEDGKEIAQGKVGEEVRASLAFQDGRIYIRGKQHLFAIEAK